jgi:type IV pilus assembly protein PilA
MVGTVVERSRRIRALREQGENGFSMVELLVVVLIVSVLAAIAVMAFLNQRERSYEAQAQSTLKNAATAMESYASTNNGDYPNTDTSEPIGDLVGEGWRKTDGVVLEIARGDVGNYCLEADHSALGADWHLEGNSGKAMAGSCPP